MIYFRVWIGVFFLTTFNWLMADDFSQSEYYKFSEAKPRPSFFSTDYYGFGYARNFPTQESKKNLKSQPGAFFVDYRYFLSDSWSLGLFGGIKHFLREVLLPIEGSEGANEIVSAENPPQMQQQDIYFVCIGEQTDYLTRIYHPVYASVGMRTFLMMPLSSLRLPIARATDQDPELGAGLVLSALYFYQRALVFRFYIERWRGTSSSKLHGFEAGLGLLWSFE